MKNLMIAIASLCLLSFNSNEDPDLGQCFEVAVDLYENTWPVTGQERAISIAAGYYEDCANGDFE